MKKGEKSTLQVVWWAEASVRRRNNQFLAILKHSIHSIIRRLFLQKLLL